MNIRNGSPTLFCLEIKNWGGGWGGNHFRKNVLHEPHDKLHVILRMSEKFPELYER